MGKMKPAKLTPESLNLPVH